MSTYIQRLVDDKCETEYGKVHRLLSQAEVADLLGCSNAKVLELVSGGEVFKVAAKGKYCYPMGQFTHHGRVISCMKPLYSMAKKVDKTGWLLAWWLVKSADGADTPILDLGSKQYDEVVQRSLLSRFEEMLSSYSK